MTNPNAFSDAGSIDELTGVWDIDRAPLSLGGLLILVEELKMQNLNYQAKTISICLVGAQTDSMLSGQSFQKGLPIILLNQKECESSGLLSLLLDLEGIDVCYLSPSLDKFQIYIKAKSTRHVLWPQLNIRDGIGYQYGSTLFVQKFYAENGFIPFLSCKKGPMKWAVNFLAQNVFPSLPVVIHLKNNPNQKGFSNADFASWYSFFFSCASVHDVQFILIGNEPIDPKIMRLPNIQVARNAGSNLTRDLALIQAGHFFMGMSSGPCIMALLNDRPYVIFKNPDHDVEDMAIQLGAKNRFTFASPLQKVLRVFETPKSLTDEFIDLKTNTNRFDWEKQLEQWK